MSNTNFVPSGTAILNSSTSAHASSASASEGAASRSARTYSRRPTAVRLGRRGDTRGVGLRTMATPLTDRSSSAVPTRSLPCAGSTMPAASCMIRSRTTKWLKSQWMIAGSGREERSGTLTWKASASNPSFSAASRQIERGGAIAGHVAQSARLAQRQRVPVIRGQHGHAGGAALSGLELRQERNFSAHRLLSWSGTVRSPGRPCCAGAARTEG